MQKFPMTASGLVALEDELRHLKAVERPAQNRLLLNDLDAAAGQPRVADQQGCCGQRGNASRITAMKRSTRGSKCCVIITGPNSGELFT